MPPLALPPSGWSHASSPFHEGERRAQARAGVADKLEAVGRRLIHTAMPASHRELFEKLPYLVLGAADDRGRLWASLLTGPAGFVRAPDEHTLHVAARPVRGDPMTSLLSAGRAIAVLGVELATRRRNRANGVVADARDPRGVTLQIAQSFGNCPQYIQARRPLMHEPLVVPALAPAPEGPRLSDAATQLIERADTFFIATATSGPAQRPADGADVSHRGGKPGFVAVTRTSRATTLVAPDFRGNFLFNTLGNLELNPRAGLLFPDFASGDLLSLTGRATVSWDDPRIATFAGAQRLLEFQVEAGMLLSGALPWRWSPAEEAPQLVATGRWPSAS
ncbi:MAG: pyridoxamine 5'-phosphate oxidase family protein [Kofleriaceae bacterium]